MKVCVVTVTYGNRFNFLKQVINAALSEGVAKVIVVDNNSVPESREKLSEYEKELENQKIKVLYLDDNYGSAGGYKKGLEEAYNDPECEFIWLLDDDNVPENNSLEKLLQCYKYLEKSNSIFALQSFREHQYRSIEYLNSYIRKNNFLSHNFLFAIKQIVFGQTNEKNIPIDIMPLFVYGGLFFRKNLLDIIGFPNSRFFIYFDDAEYTFRITQNNGKIYLCRLSIIRDIDSTSEKNSLIHSFFQKTISDNKIYFIVRNGVIFSKQFITNESFYFLNMLFYLLYLLIRGIKIIRFIGIKFFVHRFKLVIKAIIDGIKQDTKEFFGGR